jgi:heterodisulfide reductase subunit A
MDECQDHLLRKRNPKPMAKKKQVLVIGAGVAGLTAAQELAQMGVHVLLIERRPFIGGHAANFTCKATDKCAKCNYCLVQARLKETFRDNGFELRLRTEVEAIERNGKMFQVSFRSGPEIIDPEKCTDCGLCYEKCPEGAIIAAPSPHLHPFYAIDPFKCTDLQDKEKRSCQPVCPEGAINFDEEEEIDSRQVDGVLLAIGYEPFDPGEIKRFNFQQFKNVVTEMDLERVLRLQGDIYRPSDNAPPKSMAFIQCVGSRDPHLNHDYCSRVCCGYALRMALRIIHVHPQIQITLFYMDIQNFGKDFERYYEDARNSIRLIRGLPGDFYPASNDTISLSFYDEETRRTITEDFDMIILSVGITPSASHGFFKDMLGLSLNQDGFFSAPDQTQNKGIFVAGSAEGPMNVAESITHGKRAALEMAKYLGVVKDQ